MKYYFILFLFLFLTSNTFAQGDDSYNEQSDDYEDYSTETSTYDPVNPETVSKKNGYDAEEIRLRKFDQKTWKKVIGDNDYSEDEPGGKQQEQANLDSGSGASSNSKKRFLPDDQSRAEEQEVSSSASSMPIASLFMQILFYTLIIVVIGYILFLIVKNTSLKPTKKKVTKPDVSDHSVPVEDIKELEIDRLLREALASGNYRLAIRIYFLGLLKSLDEGGFIDWKKNKTNRDYLSELFLKGHYFEEVKELAIAYEQIWYGDHHLNMHAYEQIISSFKAIDQKLKAVTPQ